MSQVPVALSGHAQHEEGASVAHTQKMPTYSRILSHNELSYFLPSRAYGLNDLFSQFTFRAPSALVTYHRVCLVWAIVRLRHPLLASRIEMSPGVYDDAQFAYCPPSSPRDALRVAENNSCVYKDRTAGEVIEDFLNGPRLLSAKQLSFLHLVARDNDGAPTREYDIIIYYVHCICDGLAAHQLGHVLLSLLGGSAGPGQPVRSDRELEALLNKEWTSQWGKAQGTSVIPSPAEARIPAALSKFQMIASKVEHKAKQDRYLGGHIFPRAKSSIRKTRISNISFDEAQTSSILARCKSEGVTVSNALFVICNFAWMRTVRSLDSLPSSETLPMMMYTAISLRPFFQTRSADESFFFLAVSYLNVVLPSFLPSTAPQSAVFWNRARWVRQQCVQYIRSPFLPMRVHNMSQERAVRAKRFAKEDDEMLLATVNTNKPPTPAKPSPPPSSPSPPARAPQQRPPSVALLGLSQMNNVDDIYIASAYPDIHLSFVGGHTRKGPGGMLLFSHTFRGRLHLMFGWDAPAFQPGVVEKFWENVQHGVEKFMVGGQRNGYKL